MASDGPRSVVASIIVLVVGIGGMLLAIYGAYVAVNGITEPSKIELTIGALELKTSQVGLAILSIGAFLSFIAISAIPQNVRLFGAGQEPSNPVQRIMARLGDIKPKLLIPAIATLIFGVGLFAIITIL